MNWEAVRVWGAVILLLDASFGLWSRDRISQMVPRVNVFLMAMIEVGVATALLIVHVLF